MTTALSLISPVLMEKVAIAEITDCNDLTFRYGLALTPAEARELVTTRAEALRNLGRIELAGGIIKKLILKFCDSPFLSQHNYAETLNDLVETFYHFKNETLDELDDDELLSLMKKYFDSNCQGSLELLQDRELDGIARNVRFGVKDYDDLQVERDAFLFLEEEYFEEEYFEEEYFDD